MATIVMLPMANFTRPPSTCFPSSSIRGKSSILAKPCLSTAATRNIKAASSLNQTTISSNPSSSGVIRRSGNYEPTPWNFEFIQSLNNDYVGEKYMKRSNKLKEDIKKMMMNNVDHGAEELEKLELINNLQRLGVGYHFKEEIMQVLKCIHQRSTYRSSENSLYATALKFRLLRQHGFNISEDIFSDFKVDQKGNFKQCLCKDIEGLLQLYEASFLSIDETESTLESANRFTTSHLKNYINQYDEEDNVTVQLARHALELPLHWMLVRAEARWYISIYEKMTNANPLLLEFAKLDFNYVQAAHQQELKILSRDWWKSSSLAKKLPYARDRLIEAFFWPSGVTFDPKMNHCRRMLTKVTAMATFIDDTYDVYGTLDELELFTHAVERMEVKAMEQLPDYMKVLYLALFNVVTEIGYEVLKEQGLNAIPYLQKGWADLCKCYLREARWYYSGYTPTLQEYMDNAWISVGAPVILVGAFFFTNNPITQEALESLSKYTDIIRWCTTIVRLADDLATTSDEMKRGDVPSSIQCYMNEKDVSEEEAREHIKLCIKETWNRINKAQREKSFYSETFVEAVVNMARTGQSIYQYGDGHGIQNCDIKKRYSDLYFEPIKSPIL